jgi:hypothetical protein
MIVQLARCRRRELAEGPQRLGARRHSRWIVVQVLASPLQQVSAEATHCFEVPFALRSASADLLCRRTTLQ